MVSLARLNPSSRSSRAAEPGSPGGLQRLSARLIGFQGFGLHAPGF